MEDRRVRRTKKILKETLIELIEEIPFDKITVTEICDRADVSRITFYTHYDNKNDLIEEIFKDYFEEAVANFYLLEKENNPSQDTYITCCNMLESLLDLHRVHNAFFAPFFVNNQLYHQFYNRIYNFVRSTFLQDTNNLVYSVEQTVAFLCQGMWGFIEKGIAEGHSPEKIKEESKTFLIKLLKSDFFMKFE